MASSAPSLAIADLFNVNGLVAVVTGGGTGIGLMMATALEQNGAKVYIVGRRKELLEKVAKEHAKHGNIIPIVGDVTSKPELERITEQITKEVGYINLLVANAGISGPPMKDISFKGPNQSSLEDVKQAMWEGDQERFDSTLDINVGGVYLSVIAFMTLLDAGNKKGNVVQASQVVATSSVAAYTRIPASHYVYSASKAGVNHLMKQFSTTFAKYRIRFNTICPGPYPSEMTTSWTEGIKSMTEEQRIANFSPLGRMGETEDIAGLILFLASRAGAYISGSTVLTDGGRTAVVPATLA